MSASTGMKIGVFDDEDVVAIRLHTNPLGESITHRMTPDEARAASAALLRSADAIDARRVAP